MPEDVLRDTNAPFSTSATPLDEGNKILCAVLPNHRQKKSLEFLQRRVIGDGCLPSLLSSFLSGMEDAHSATGWNLRVRRHPLTCIQALWLKTKSIAWVMGVTELGKVASDQNNHDVTY